MTGDGIWPAAVLDAVVAVDSVPESLLLLLLLRFAVVAIKDGDGSFVAAEIAALLAGAM